MENILNNEVIDAKQFIEDINNLSDFDKKFFIAGKLFTKENSYKNNKAILDIINGIDNVIVKHYLYNNFNTDFLDQDKDAIIESNAIKNTIIQNIYKLNDDYLKKYCISGLFDSQNNIRKLTYEDKKQLGELAINTINDIQMLSDLIKDNSEIIEYVSEPLYKLQDNDKKLNLIKILLELNLTKSNKQAIKRAINTIDDENIKFNLISEACKKDIYCLKKGEEKETINFILKQADRLTEEDKAYFISRYFKLHEKEAIDKVASMLHEEFNKKNNINSKSNEEEDKMDKDDSIKNEDIIDIINTINSESIKFKLIFDAYKQHIYCLKTENETVNYILNKSYEGLTVEDGIFFINQAMHCNNLTEYSKNKIKEFINGIIYKNKQYEFELIFNAYKNGIYCCETDEETINYILNNFKERLTQEDKDYFNLKLSLYNVHYLDSKEKIEDIKNKIENIQNGQNRLNLLLRLIHVDNDIGYIVRQLEEDWPLSKKDKAYLVKELLESYSLRIHEMKTETKEKFIKVANEVDNLELKVDLISALYSKGIYCYNSKQETEKQILSGIIGISREDLKCSLINKLLSNINNIEGGRSILKEDCNRNLIINEINEINNKQNKLFLILTAYENGIYCIGDEKETIKYIIDNYNNFYPLSEEYYSIVDKAKIQLKGYPGYEDLMLTAEERINSIIDNTKDEKRKFELILEAYRYNINIHYFRDEKEKMDYLSNKIEELGDEDKASKIIHCLMFCCDKEKALKVINPAMEKIKNNKLIFELIFKLYLNGIYYIKNKAENDDGRDNSEITTRNYILDNIINNDFMDDNEKYYYTLTMFNNLVFKNENTLNRIFRDIKDICQQGITDGIARGKDIGPQEEYFLVEESSVKKFREIISRFKNNELKYNLIKKLNTSNIYGNDFFEKLLEPLTDNNIPEKNKHGYIMDIFEKYNDDIEKNEREQIIKIIFDFKDENLKTSLLKKASELGYDEEISLYKANRISEEMLYDLCENDDIKYNTFEELKKDLFISAINFNKNNTSEDIYVQHENINNCPTSNILKKITQNYIYNNELKDLQKLSKEFDILNAQGKQLEEIKTKIVNKIQNMKLESKNILSKYLNKKYNLFANSRSNISPTKLNMAEKTMVELINERSNTDIGTRMIDAISK